MSNSNFRYCQHDRYSSCFAHLLLGLGLVATVCGCHYCPYNRHVLKPGQSCASDHICRADVCHPGGRHSRSGCVSENRHYSGCTDEQLEAYYPTPEANDSSAAPAEVVETPADAAIDVSVEDPAVDIVEESPAEPALLQPFTPFEDFPPPPSVTAEPPVVESPLTPQPDSTQGDSTAPLFGGPVELNDIEIAPLEQTAIPDAALSPVEPSAPTPAVPALPETRSIEETKESPFGSLFQLRFPPRLFRLRDDAEEESDEAFEAVEPVPPISETSATQGSRLNSGHSLTSPVPTWAASGSDSNNYGHSLR